MQEEIDMAYAAGILDGDGSFSIMKAQNKYYPCIQLSNAFKEMSEWLHEKFGGSLRIKKPQQPHHKMLYVWSVRGLDGCESLIEKIEPFIVLKRLQAKYMLEFIEARKEEFPTAKDGEFYALLMKDLNTTILIGNDNFCPQAQINTENHTFWSYVAGIMDTEGSFSIKKEKPHSGSVSIRYNPVIQLTMVPVAVLNFIRSNCSYGSFCMPKASSATKGFAYKMLIASKEQCMHFIYKVLPHIRYKKGQVFTLLNFCENFGRTAFRQGKVPLEMLEFREEMYKQMRKLNA